MREVSVGVDGNRGFDCLAPSGSSGRVFIPVDLVRRPNWFRPIRLNTETLLLSSQLPDQARSGSDTCSSVVTIAVTKPFCSVEEMARGIVPLLRMSPTKRSIDQSNEDANNVRREPHQPQP